MIRGRDSEVDGNKIARTPTDYLSFPKLLWHRCNDPSSDKFGLPDGEALSGGVDVSKIHAFVDEKIRQRRYLNKLAEKLVAEHYKTTNEPCPKLVFPERKHTQRVSYPASATAPKPTCYIQFPSLLWERDGSGNPSGPDLVWGITAEEIRDFVEEEFQKNEEVLRQFREFKEGRNQ